MYALILSKPVRKHLTLFIYFCDKAEIMCLECKNYYIVNSVFVGTNNQLFNKTIKSVINLNFREWMMTNFHTLPHNKHAKELTE